MRRHQWLASMLSLCLIGSLAGRAMAQAPRSSGRAVSGASASATSAEMLPLPTGNVGYHAAAPPAVGGAGYASTYQGPPASAPPQTLFPYPQMTPFADQYSRLNHEEGLWQQIVNNGGRKYHASIEAIWTRRKRPDGVVGDSHALSYKDLVLPGIRDTLGETFLADAFEGIGTTTGSSGGTGTGSGSGGTAGGVQQGSTVPVFTPFNYYDREYASRVQDIRGSGFRAALGFTNVDNSGFELNGFWAINNDATWTASEDSYRKMSEPAVLQTLLDAPDFNLVDVRPSTIDDILEGNLLNLRGLPLNDGSLRYLGDGRWTGGVTAPYDLEYTIKFRSQTTGMTGTGYPQPILEKGAAMARPRNGVRLMNTPQSFYFLGRDSGLYYDNQAPDDEVVPDLKLQSLPNGIDENQDGIIDNAAAAEGVSVSGGVIAALEATVEQAEEDQEAALDQLTAASANRVLICGEDNQNAGTDACTVAQEAESQAASTLSDANIALAEARIALDNAQTAGDNSTGGRYIRISDPITSYLNNQATTYLVGPEIGLDYTIGGDNFKVTGHTTLSLMFNHENIKMQGDNIGMTTRPDDFLTPTAGNPNPNRFYDSRNTSHVSPLFEQALFVEMNIFGGVPVLKRMQVLENANLKLGLTWMAAGAIVNPAESIRWDGNPSAGLFPTIDIKRASWSSWNWSAGIDWEF